AASWSRSHASAITAASAATSWIATCRARRPRCSSWFRRPRTSSRGSRAAPASAATRPISSASPTSITGPRPPTGIPSIVADAVRRRNERFTFHTTLSVDEYSHKWGPFADRVLDAYRSFDGVIGDLAKELSATGQLDSSLLVLSADHGHSEVRRHLDLEGFFE